MLAPRRAIVADAWFAPFGYAVYHIGEDIDRFPEGWRGANFDDVRIELESFIDRRGLLTPPKGRLNPF